MKLLLYCTKGKPYLLQSVAKPMHTKDTTNPFNYKWRLIEKQTSNTLNGKIVAECDYEVEEIYPFYRDFMCEDIFYEIPGKLDFDDLLKKSCLDNQQLDDYLYANKGYAIHIKNLHIFDEPKELKDLEPKREIHQCIHGNLIIDEEFEIPIKAPQNMMRVKLRKSYYNGMPVNNDDINANEETLEDYILISIHPEWLCKILNGEKTIEIRKKVLKEML